jgi:hypothetical protein
MKKESAAKLSSASKTTMRWVLDDMALRIDCTLLTGSNGTIVAVPSPFNDASEDPFVFILEAA